MIFFIIKTDQHGNKLIIQKCPEPLEVNRKSICPEVDMKWIKSEMEYILSASIFLHNSYLKSHCNNVKFMSFISRNIECCLTNINNYNKI